MQTRCGGRDRSAEQASDRRAPSEGPFSGDRQEIRLLSQAAGWDRPRWTTTAADRARLRAPGVHCLPLATEEDGGRKSDGAWHSSCQAGAAGRARLRRIWHAQGPWNRD